MADVIAFRTSVERILICDCGCSTFNFLEDGSARCAACEDGVIGRGSWYLLKPDLSEYDGEKGPVSHVQGNGSIEFARRRVSQIASSDEASMIIAAAKSGTVHVWADAETEDQKAWALRRLDEARALIEAREVV